MKDPTSGYLFGLILSAVAAVGVTIAGWVYLRALVVRCFMSLGCNDSPVPVLLLMLAGYLLIVAVLTAVASRVFNCRPLVAFLLNVAPLVALTAVQLLWIQYRDYAWDRDVTRGIRTAITDAPAIHLGAPYVKMVDSSNGGVILFLHVPFTVDKTIQSHSLYVLVTFNDRPSDIRYSAQRECNDGFVRPDFGFHIVDREYSETPQPAYVSSTTIVSKQLHPGTQYYLLRELHFGHSSCHVSDYADFDPKQIRIVLDVDRARKDLEER